LWNAAPYPLTARVGRSGTNARLVDAVGGVQRLPADAEEYVMALPPATCNTDPNDPARYLMGGETYLIVESDVPPEQVAAAPRADRGAPPELRGSLP
jgi:hypothetical protein